MTIAIIVGIVVGIVVGIISAWFASILATGRIIESLEGALYDGRTTPDNRARARR